MNSWIIPCNLKYFNVVNYLKNHSSLVWRKTPRIKKGDIVYIYVGIPVKAIKYRCMVVDEDVKKDVLDQNAYAKVGDIEHNRKYMQLRVINEYADEINLSKIQELGMFMIRRQIKADGKVKRYLDVINQNYN